MNEKDQHLHVSDLDGEEALFDAESGLVIGIRGNRLLRLNTDRHIVTVGSSGSGKNCSVAIPNLLSHQGSVFSFEIGDTCLKETVHYRRNALKQDVYVIDPFKCVIENTDTINFLDTFNPDHADFVPRVNRFVDGVLLDSLEPVKDSMPFFCSVAKQMLSGLIIFVKTASELSDQQRNLLCVADILNGTHEAFIREKQINERDYWENVKQRFIDDKSSHANCLNKMGINLFTEQDDFWRDIVATLAHALDFTRDPAISKMLATSSVDLSKLNNNTSLFVVMDDTTRAKANKTWLRLLVESAVDACPVVQSELGPDSSGNRSLFILDHFPMLGKCSFAKDGFIEARRKGINIWCQMGNLVSLEQTYGKNEATQILETSGCIQSFQMFCPRSASLIQQYAGSELLIIPEEEKLPSTYLIFSSRFTKDWTDFLSPLFRSTAGSQSIAQPEVVAQQGTSIGRPRALGHFVIPKSEMHKFNLVSLLASEHAQVLIIRNAKDVTSTIEERLNYIHVPEFREKVCAEKSTQALGHKNKLLPPPHP